MLKGSQSRTKDTGGPAKPEASRGRPRLWTYLILAAALCLAAFLLHRTLSRYSLDQIVQSVGAVPVSRLLAAGGFAAASYFCLTFFDFLGLRYAGRPLPYPRVAFTSFTALSIGHNLGFAALSTGAIRYRFYSRWGLRTEQIAKVILFSATTVGLGLMVLGGAALLLRPALASEITGLERSLLLALGSLCFALPLAYLGLAWKVRRPLHIRKWSFEMPPLRLALAQLVIGPINFALVAAVLHQALAAIADVAYFGVASVYVIATVTALVSHVPGGLGVIESVVLFLLPQADLIGALIVFRFAYFLVPLGIGSCMFALAELTFRLSDREGRRGAV